MLSCDVNSVIDWDDVENTGQENVASCTEEIDDTQTEGTFDIDEDDWGPRVHQNKNRCFLMVLKHNAASLRDHAKSILTIPPGHTMQARDQKNKADRVNQSSFCYMTLFIFYRRLFARPKTP